MEVELGNILMMIGGVLFGIIGYFLKNAMSELNKLRGVCYETKSRLDVIEREYGLKHTHLTEKFDELHDAVKDLTREIKSLTSELHKKKD